MTHEESLALVKSGKIFTFVCCIPGAGGHTFLKTLENESTLKYLEPSQVNLPSDQWLSKLDVYQAFPNHATYCVDMGESIPNVRLPKVGHRPTSNIQAGKILRGKKILPISTQENILAEVYLKHQKQMLFVSHWKPSKIKEFWPESTVHFINVPEQYYDLCKARADSFRSIHPNLGTLPIPYDSIDPTSQGRSPLTINPKEDNLVGANYIVEFEEFITQHPDIMK